MEYKNIDLFQKVGYNRISLMNHHMRNSGILCLRKKSSLKEKQNRFSVCQVPKCVKMKPKQSQRSLHPEEGLNISQI